MAAVLKQISPSVVNAMIRSWRIARLACDQGKLSYPQINILHPEHGVGEEDFALDDSDADLVQAIVEKMPADIRRVFVAYHLAIVNGDYCRHGHKVRRLLLGDLSVQVYEARERAGWIFIRDWLEVELMR